MFKKIFNIKIIIFTILIEWITNFGNNIVLLIFIAFILFLILLNTYKNFKFLIILFLISDDQSRFLSEDVLGKFAEAIYTVYTFPNLSMIITIVIFVISLKLVLSHKKMFSFNEMKVMIKLTTVIFIMGFLMGIFKILEYSRIAMQDMSYLINFFTFLILTYYIYIYNKDSLDSLLKSIVTAITVKYAILLWLFITGNGEIVGSMVKVTGESGKSLVPLYACMFFLLFIFIKSSKRYFFLLMFLISLVITLSIASRSTMLFIVLSLIIILFLMRVNKVKRLFYIGLSIGGVSMGVFAIEYIHPGSILNVLWKLNTIGEININSTSFSSLSAVTRYIELLNIFYMHLENNTLLFGSGFASYFTDDYVKFPFNLFGTSSYRSEWIVAGTYFKPHTTPIFLFLKIGIFGVLFYYYSFLKIFISMKNKIKNIPIGLNYVFLLAILPNIFLIITKNYSSKMQIALGIYIAISFLIIQQIKIKSEA